MLRTLVIFSVVGLSWAALAWSSLPPKPAELAHKTGCYVKEMNDVVPFGVTVNPIGVCVRISCGKEMMSYASCGAVLAGPGCSVTEPDLSKPYPACCPKFKCSMDNKVQKD